MKPPPQNQERVQQEIEIVDGYITACSKILNKAVCDITSPADENLIDAISALQLAVTHLNLRTKPK